MPGLGANRDLGQNELVASLKLAVHADGDAFPVAGDVQAHDQGVAAAGRVRPDGNGAAVDDDFSR